MFQPLQGHLQGARNLYLLYIHCLCLSLCYISHVVTFYHFRLEDDLVKAETCVGVKQ
jgi:hypothetical protein